MKSMLFLLAFVAGLILLTAFSGNGVEAFDRFFSFRTVDENGDVYRVQRRAEAYCDGTIVVHERQRLLYEGCDVSACDVGSCDRGWNYSEPRAYGASCDADASSCDRRMSRRVRPLYR